MAGKETQTKITSKRSVTRRKDSDRNAEDTEKDWILGKTAVCVQVTLEPFKHTKKCKRVSWALQTNFMRLAENCHNLRECKHIQRPPRVLRFFWPVIILLALIFQNGKQK